MGRTTRETKTISGIQHAKVSHRLNDALPLRATLPRPLCYAAAARLYSRARARAVPAIRSNPGMLYPSSAFDELAARPGTITLADAVEVDEAPRLPALAAVNARALFRAACGGPPCQRRRGIAAVYAAALCCFTGRGGGPFKSFEHTRKRRCACARLPLLAQPAAEHPAGLGSTQRRQPVVDRGKRAATDDVVRRLAAVLARLFDVTFIRARCCSGTLTSTLPMPSKRARTSTRCGKLLLQTPRRRSSTS